MPGSQTSLFAVKALQYDDARDAFYATLRDVVENLGCVEVAGSVGVSGQRIHQALRGGDNCKVPVDWLPALLDLDSSGRLVRALALMGGGDFTPKDARSPEQKLAALEVEVAKFGEAGLQALRAAGLK